MLTLLFTYSKVIVVLVVVVEVGVWQVIGLGWIWGELYVYLFSQAKLNIILSFYIYMHLYGWPRPK